MPSLVGETTTCCLPAAQALRFLAPTQLPSPRAGARRPRNHFAVGLIPAARVGLGSEEVWWRPATSWEGQGVVASDTFVTGSPPPATTRTPQSVGAPHHKSSLPRVFPLVQLSTAPTQSMSGARAHASQYDRWASTVLSSYQLPSFISPLLVILPDAANCHVTTARVQVCLHAIACCRVIQGSSTSPWPVHCIVFYVVWVWAGFHVRTNFYRIGAR